MKTVLKIIGGLVVLAVVLFIILMATVAYRINRSEQDAQAFCDGVALGEDLQTVIARSEATAVSFQRETDGEGRERYAFVFPGFIYSYATCDIRVEASRVSAKEVVEHND